MSSFVCEKCGKAIVEGPDGRYVTECEHYLVEKFKTEHAALITLLEAKHKKDMRGNTLEGITTVNE